MTRFDFPPIAAFGMEQAIRQLPAAVAVFDVSGRVLYTNAKAEELAETLGGTLPDRLDDGFDMFHLDGRRYEQEEWPAVRSMGVGEEVVDEEYFHLLPDGGRLVMRAMCSPVYDEDGRIIAAVLVTADVTDQTLREDRPAYHGEMLDSSGDRDLTQLNIVEEQLKEERGRSATILESISEAFVAVDAAWRFTYANDRALRHMRGRLGKRLARADVIGKVMWELFPDAENTEIGGRLLEAMSDRGDLEFESYYAPSNEWIAAHVHPFEDGLAIYYRNISEQKRADYQRREAETTIFESITDAFYLLDSDWRFAYVNERAVQELGELLGEDLGRDDLLGESLWEMFPAVLGTDTEKNFRRAVRDRRSIVYDYLYPATRTWFENHVYPSDGGLSVYFRNIDSRKLAEADREQRTRQQEAVARLGVRGLASDDLQSLMDEAAEVVAEMLAVEISAIVELLPGGRRLLLRAGVGWGPGAIGNATVPAGSRSLGGYTVEAGESVLSEDIAADQRFSVSPALASLDPVSGACVVIAGRDKPFGTLGAFAKQRRTFSAADENFLQAVANVISAAAERADVESRMNEVREAERRRLARDLHDDALRDLTHALAQASRDESAGDLLPALRRVGQQLRGAIYDLRLAADEDRPFRELLTELVELHRAMAPGVEIRLEGGEALPHGSLGSGDSEVLRILSEAITNARRHSGAPTIQVRIADGHGVLRLEVADNGSGAEWPEPAVGGGAGVKGMIERAALLGAQLEIDAPSGGGTTVSLLLPVEGSTDGEIQRTRVLLVEDHTAVREAMAAMFKQEPDFEVVGQAASLAEARWMLGNVDVALLDLGLPDGYGADLIKELREVNPGAQAIVLSASLDRADMARAVQKGAAGALNKNVHLLEVVDAVRRLREGETLLPMDEVVELLQYAGRREAEQREDLAAIDRLTRREREILQALADGLDSRQIAEALHITLRTQRNHVASILGKLGVHSQLQALVLALRYGVVEVRQVRERAPAGPVGRA